MLDIVTTAQRFGDLGPVSSTSISRRAILESLQLLRDRNDAFQPKIF